MFAERKYVSGNTSKPLRVDSPPIATPYEPSSSNRCASSGYAATPSVAVFVMVPLDRPLAPPFVSVNVSVTGYEFSADKFAGRINLTVPDEPEPPDAGTVSVTSLHSASHDDTALLFPEYIE